jgi:enoyl-[acyl-carrier protein] reductase II
MVWCSGWKLASAVSNSGGLGLIGAGSMTPELLLYHLNQMELHTTRPYGVNVPLLYSNIEAHIQVIETSPVPIVFTSAGNPALYTARLKAAGKTVVHVVSSAAFAEKAARAGVDAVVAEGVEAGGHNGKEETTTLCLIPLVKAAVSIPVIAAGGIASGRAMAAVIALGADGVQIGSAFAVAKESSAHERFKTAVLQSKEGDTVLTLKELAPVRLLKNNFYDEIKNAYTQHVGIEALRALLGKGRSKKGIFEGNLDEGELEIGQVAAQLKDEPTAEEIIHRILQEYRLTIDSIPYF